MGFNKYILNIIIRSVLIAITALIMVVFAVKLDWIFTFIFICILFCLQIFLLIRYASKVNRDIANFLIHLKEQNTTLKLSSHNIDKIFGGLSNEFERINQGFKKIENEKIQKQNLLNLILERVGTGILLINYHDEIKLFNKALLNLLGITAKSNKSELNKKINHLVNECPNLKPGEQNIINISVNNITRRILIALSEIKEAEEKIKIYSFHDIDREMTDYELQSWNGMMKVLSHEILNTVTPISTTVDTLKDCYIYDGEDKKPENINKKDIQDTVKSIHILENRINGLKGFISKFRQFLDIPVPELKTIPINDLFKLILETYQKENIKFSANISSKTISILADKELTELVFINIIKNAIEAQATEIKLDVFQDDLKTIISIKDNGTGIEPNILKKIFLPFYTTKSHGSGIGLSIARQIMFAHKGSIEVQSSDKGTIINLIFPY